MKSAISINNAGVSLLQKGHFELARECFRDAVAVVANAIPGDDQILLQGQRQQLSSEEIKGKVIDANRKLARACLQPEISLPSTTCIDLVQDDENNMLSASDAFWRCISTDRVFLIRIEQVPNSAPYEPQVDTCVILSNYAAAHKMIARERRQTSNMEDHPISFHVGLQLWKLAYSGMARLLTEHQASIHFMEKTCLIAHNLIGGLMEAGMSDEAEMYKAPLENMLLYLQSYHTFTNSTPVSVASAA